MSSGAWTAVGTIALAVVTVIAVITSIVITVQDRRRADEALKRAARREEDTWRRALHQERWQNIDLGKEQPADGLWSFDVSILRESTVHAAAFPLEVLQRIIWARTANERLEAQLSSLRAGEAVLADTFVGLQQLRAKVLGEISEIEKQLRP